MQVDLLNDNFPKKITSLYTTLKVLEWIALASCWHHHFTVWILNEWIHINSTVKCANTFAWISSVIFEKYLRRRNYITKDVWVNMYKKWSQVWKFISLLYCNVFSEYGKDSFCNLLSIWSIYWLSTCYHEELDTPYV